MSKVNRKRINWIQVLNDQDNPEFFKYFYQLATKLHRGKHLSLRRCAYYTLKHFYSTTTIDELVEKIGISLC